MNQAAIGMLTVLLAAIPQANAQEREPANVRQTPESSTAVNGPEQQIRIHKVSGSGEGQFIGIIRAYGAAKGAYFEPALEGLEPGLHGFHIHQNPDCGPEIKEGKTGTGATQVAAGAAGDHLEPGISGTHAGPYGDGHVGDLPNLYVDENGVAKLPVYAPRVQVSDLPGHSLVIHANPDNYSDEPENGGSGDRIACGIIP